MMAAANRSNRENRLVLLAPTQRDGSMTRHILAEACVHVDLCTDLRGLSVELTRPLGAVLLPEELLADGGLAALEGWLGNQAPWSDLPILLMVAGGPASAVAEEAMTRLGNVSLLERPLRVATLISSVRTALRARRRQYQIREHLLERERYNEMLESRVAERTAVAEQRAAQLGALASELTHAETRERRRLARVLHDHLQQLLVAARLSLDMALPRQPDDMTRSLVQRAADLIKETIEESRSLTVELSPPILYEGGLAPALEWLGRWISEKHGLKVDVQVDSTAEPDKEEARILLFQSARELLFNVVKHAGADHATLTLAWEGEDVISVEVIDRGAGFSAGAQPAGSHTGDGDHFGLFSIRERLSVLGGTLEVQSAAGIGTSARVMLPGRSSRTSPIRGTTTPRSVQEQPTPAACYPRHPGRISVLLADDHEILRDGLAGLLREEPDIDVVGQASDGSEAVRLAEQLQPDVIVMDVTMPVLSGIQATRQITQRHSGVRIIGLSMHDQSDMAEAMRDAGAAAFLTKGGAAEALIACIRELVSRDARCAPAAPQGA